MKHTLDNSHSVYIQMNVTGVVDKSGLLSAMSELINHPDYQDKHSLWDFTHATMGLSIGDLGEIVGVLGLFWHLLLLVDLAPSHSIRAGPFAAGPLHLQPAARGRPQLQGPGFWVQPFRS